METFLLLGFALLIISIYWFRWLIGQTTHRDIMLWWIAFLGWIFAWSTLLYALNYSAVSEIYYYQWIIWPFLEELAKFLVIFFLFKNFHESFKWTKWITSVWILVGLGFWVYENIIYIWAWIDDFFTILYRSIFVWGLILHPLTWGIFGYMIWISKELDKIMPTVFLNQKNNFDWILGIFGLIKTACYKTKKYIKETFNIIRKILILDTTTNHIIIWKKTKHWHSPSEFIYEWFFLWVWIHILYNSILVHMQDAYLIVWFFSIIITILLTQLFMALFNSKILWYTISVIIISWFLFPSTWIWQWALFLSLIMLIVILLLFGWELNKKINIHNPNKV